MNPRLPDLDETPALPILVSYEIVYSRVLRKLLRKLGRCGETISPAVVNSHPREPLTTAVTLDDFLQVAFLQALAATAGFQRADRVCQALRQNFGPPFQVAAKTAPLALHFT